MQQRPNNQSVELVRAGGTQPALPGATAPTTPITSQQVTYNGRGVLRKGPIAGGGRAVLQLLALGFLLEVLLLMLYPLLTVGTSGNDAVRQALPGVFPWLPRVYWTSLWPLLPDLLAGISWLNPTTAEGAANLTFIVAFLGLLLVFLATRVVRRAMLERLSLRNMRLLFVIALLFSCLFGITMFFAPIANTQMAHDMVLYGLYSRIVSIYGNNPYVVAPGNFPQDIFQTLSRAHGTAGTAPYGPVWVGISILVTLLAHNSVANVLLGFRGIGLVAYISTALLIWGILGRLKPELRLSGMLLYAWNPIILLLSISMMHLDIVLAMFLLLAVFFFQRASPTLGWVFALLAALINPLCLLLLPLFFRLMAKQAHFLPLLQRILWWLGMIAITAIVLVLAYAAYWRGWGISGIATNIRDVFWQHNALNSLDAVVLNLPVRLPATLLWIATPSHWSLIVLGLTAVLLLPGIWLSDTVELLLLSASWLLLLLLILQPLYWPWFVILPLALAACTTSRSTVLMPSLLTFGALIGYYCWQRQPVWNGQGLGTIALPILLWGWTLFIISLWQISRANHAEQEVQVTPRTLRASRPPWLSRPSWPSRPSSRFRRKIGR